MTLHEFLEGYAKKNLHVGTVSHHNYCDFCNPVVIMQTMDASFVTMSTRLFELTLEGCAKSIYLLVL